MVAGERGEVYVTGDPNSRDFPAVDAAQSRNAGGSDAFLTEIGPTGQFIPMSTYLGGAGNDYGQAVALDRAGNIFVAGHTLSHTFPGVRALQTPHGDDAFLTELRAP